jgi:hypothetical protein
MPLKNHCPAQRMFSKSSTKHFKGLGSGFSELNVKLDADKLLDFPIYSRENKT